MHRIQKHILQKLIRNQNLRYADIKPKAVEGNLFMYHLRQLIGQGWVKKRSDGRYELTATGQLYADKLSLKTFALRAQPKIVTLIACQNQNGEWLFYRRKRQPLMGLCGFPYGKVHEGEKIQASAKRELREKTGLTAELKHRGDGYIWIYQDGGLVSEILFHLFAGTNPTGALKKKTPIGTCFWAKAEKMSGPDFIPSGKDLMELMNTQKDHFFVELTYNL